MDPMTIAMIASSLMGAQKGQEQQFAYKQQQGLEAMKTKYNTFTKNGAGQNLQRPNASDPMMQALMAGAMIGQQFKTDPSAVEQNPDVSTGKGDSTAANFNGPAAPGAVQSPGGMKGMGSWYGGMSGFDQLGRGFTGNAS